MTEVLNFHLSEANKQNLCAAIMRLDCSATRYTANVRLRKSKRSVEQNSRLWKLYTALGQHIGETPDSVHALCGYKWLRELKTINCETVEVIKSTTKLSTSEMADYQDAIEHWAAQLGFIFEDEA